MKDLNIKNKHIFYEIFITSITILFITNWILFILEFNLTLFNCNFDAAIVATSVRKGLIYRNKFDIPLKFLNRIDQIVTGCKGGK